MKKETINHVNVCPVFVNKFSSFGVEISCQLWFKVSVSNKRRELLYRMEYYSYRDIGMNFVSQLERVKYSRKLNCKQEEEINKLKSLFPKIMIY